MVRAATALKALYTKKYIVINTVIAVAYFYLVRLLIKVQGNGIFVQTTPNYIILLLSISSAMTLTIAIYAIANTRKNRADTMASATSVTSVVIGSLISGCGCQMGILASLVSFIVGASGAFAFNVIIADNALYILAAIILINIFVFIYYLNKISNPLCRVEKGDQIGAQKRQEGQAQDDKQEYKGGQA